MIAKRRADNSGPTAAFDVRVIPRAPQTRVDGLRGGALLIRLSSPPVDGAANDALIAFLAEALQLPRRSVRIVSGSKSRDKRVAIDGVDRGAALARLLR
ncbi:MAG: DUF167 domain-containing protein [Vicinamibacterales bacterium]